MKTVQISDTDPVLYRFPGGPGRKKGEISELPLPVRPGSGTVPANGS